MLKPAAFLIENVFATFYQELNQLELLDPLVDQTLELLAK
jgi:hypothetical protein